MKSIINKLDLENYIDSFKKFYARDKNIKLMGISPQALINILKSSLSKIRIFPRRLKEGLENFRFWI